LSIDKSPTFRWNPLAIPAAGDGTRVGLFGGSFNPPHQGHLQVCDLAFKRLKLQQIWWLVTPGNPLKDTSDLPNLATRINWCRQIARDPRIRITALETRFKVRFSADTIHELVYRRPKLNFVWLMGADNLARFHQWQNWRSIADNVPMAIIDRPGSTLAFRAAPAAIALAKHRVDEADASLLAHMQPPAWTFIHGPRNSLSSTEIRKTSVGNINRPLS